MAVRNIRPPLPLIAPSMLKCDFGNLQRVVEELEAAGATSLHWDVMDGHFVPNLSYGALVIKRLRETTSLVFDAHLMIENPDRYLDDYLEAGCDWVTIHLEAAPEPAPLLQRIRDAGRLAGVSLNPRTPVSALEPLLGQFDLVLVMSVEPGFGGQSFLPGSTDKVKAVRQLVGSGTLIAIDGGIGPATIPDVAAAGAEVFVVGSSIFDQPDYQNVISTMRDLAVRARA